MRSGTFKFPHLSAEALPQHLGARVPFKKSNEASPDLLIQECGHAVQIMVFFPRDSVQFSKRKKVRDHSRWGMAAR